jgi:hypothetical protein
MYPIEIQTCQRFLDSFPLVPPGNIYSGKPMFRIMWSRDCFEKRFGTYNEYESGVFIRTVTGLKEVPKYWHLPECWILEQWYPAEISFIADIPDTKNGSYECFYAFTDDKNKPLPFHPKVVEIRMKYKQMPAEVQLH